MTDDLTQVLEFARSNAQTILVDLRGFMQEVYDGKCSLDVNRVVRQVRYFFWELENVLRVALLLAARNMQLAILEPPSWEQLMAAWKTDASNSEVRDELNTLEFTWSGVDLFELRAYALMCRSGVLVLESLQSVPTGKISFTTLAPVCRKGGLPITLPDGLDRFVTTSQRFVRRLLTLSQRDSQSKS